MRIAFSILFLSFYAPLQTEGLWWAQLKHSLSILTLMLVTLCFIFSSITSTQIIGPVCFELPWWIHFCVFFVSVYFCFYEHLVDSGLQRSGLEPFLGALMTDLNNKDILMLQATGNGAHFWPLTQGVAHGLDLACVYVCLCLEWVKIVLKDGMCRLYMHISLTSELPTMIIKRW